LLVHGWEGQASDFADFVPKLLEAGHEVIAVHLPAHGNSNGAQTSIPHSARALRHVLDGLSPLHAAVAHSVGAAVLAEAMHGGLAVNRAVLIAAPANYEDYARDVAAAFCLDAEKTEDMLRQLSAQIGTDIREVSLPRRALRMQQPALFIHSGDDRVIPIEDSIASAAAWPGARHMRFEGMGHKRILSNAAVLDAALDFISTSA
jgi:pimeloyl-ACP methyl ester carboxylesterase